MERRGNCGVRCECTAEPGNTRRAPQIVGARGGQASTQLDSVPARGARGSRAHGDRGWALRPPRAEVSLSPRRTPAPWRDCPLTERVGRRRRPPSRRWAPALRYWSPTTEEDECDAHEKENVIEGPSQPPTSGLSVSPPQQANLARSCVEGGFPSSARVLHARRTGADRPGYLHNRSVIRRVARPARGLVVALCDVLGGGPGPSLGFRARGTGNGNRENAYVRESRMGQRTARESDTKQQQQNNKKQRGMKGAGPQDPDKSEAELENSDRALGTDGSAVLVSRRVRAWMKDAMCRGDL